MNAAYVRSLLSRLNLATLHVANKNKDRFYPKLPDKVDNLSDDQVKQSIGRMIHYLQAPEFSYMMFRDDLRR
jgi:hypothetical protein